HLDAQLLGCRLERRRPLAGIPDGLDPLLREVQRCDEGRQCRFLPGEVLTTGHCIPTDRPWRQRTTGERRLIARTGPGSVRSPAGSAANPPFSAANFLSLQRRLYWQVSPVVSFSSLPGMSEAPDGRTGSRRPAAAGSGVAAGQRPLEVPGDPLRQRPGAP